MDKLRPCGCKGCRTCLICEETYGIKSKSVGELDKRDSYVYCPYCNMAWPGWDLFDWRKHPNHTGIPLKYAGVYIDLNFLTKEEEQRLTEGIEGLPWDLSQSGRRKQNYGPKCNFKKRKLRMGDFHGFPKYSQFVQEKFNDVAILKGFQTIEQCSLEYDPKRGASIDPHIDDCWIWGERIVTVNLLSDSVLTTTCNKKLEKYNLDCVKEYPKVLSDDGTLNSSSDCYRLNNNCNEDVVVRIPMPRRSLLLLYGSARYDWEHQVLRNDITERRICVAYREFTPPYLQHAEKFHKAKDIFEEARQFWT